MQATQLYSKDNLFLLNNLKGLAILFVFAVHSLARPYVGMLYPLGMPIFFFFSGFAAKNENNSINIKYLSTLCSLYVFSNLLYMPFSAYLMCGQNDFSLPFLILGPNAGILWYFIALIVWYLITPIFKASRYPIIFAILFCALAFSLAHAFIPWNSKWIYIPMIFKFYPYYIIGTLISWQDILRIRNFKYKYLCIPVLFVIFALYGTNTLIYESQKDFHIHEISYLICAIFCLFAVLALFPGRKLPLLSKIGLASLNIYIFHLYVNLFANKLFVKTIGYSPIILVFAVIILSSWILSSDKVSRLMGKAVSKTKKIIFGI